MVSGGIGGSGALGLQPHQPCHRYMGPLLHLDTAPTVSASSLFAVLFIAVARDKAGAAELVALLKEHGLQQLAGEAVRRLTIVPPGGEGPGSDSDEALRTARCRR